MKIKAIIFDKDGTLMDFDSFWVTVSRYAIADIFNKTGCTNGEIEQVLESLDVKGGVADINGILAQDPFPVMGRAINRCLEKYGVILSDEEATKLTVEAYHKNIDNGIVSPACKDLAEVMKRLKSIGVILAVATTDDPYDTELCLKKLGVFEYFDEIYTDDGKLPPKPDPYCIDALCKKYGFDKNEVVMVGDTLNDVRFADNGGIDVIGVAKNKTNQKILSENITNVMDDVSQIFGYLN